MAQGAKSAVHDIHVYISVCLPGAVRSPAAPEVSLLSDTSVMVRWTAVPARRLGGLDVMFYKVQYRRVGARRKSRGWETVDEDIPSNRLAIRVNRLRPGQLSVALVPKLGHFCSKNSSLGSSVNPA